MLNLQPYLFQLIVLLATGLTMTAYAQKSLHPIIRSIGLSRWPIVVILSFSPWILNYSPQSVSLFFTEVICLIYLHVFKFEADREHLPQLNIFMLIVPLLVFLGLFLQPNLFNFAFDNVLITGLIIGISVILFLYSVIRNRNIQFLSYLFLQTTGLVILGVNYSQFTLTTGLVILVFSELLSLYHLLKALSHHQIEIYEENRQYRDDFETAVEKEVKKRTFYMELTKERMVQINRTDHLTKLLNRKSIMADIDDFIYDKNIQKFVMFIFDIDHFKQINDTLGHATGDVCLKNLAAIVKGQTGENDLSGRYGGDEFIIALANKGYKEGLSFADALMSEISKQNNPPFSISLGMAVYPWDGETYKHLFETADKGLYVAKEQGRKRLGYKGYIRP